MKKFLANRITPIVEIICLILSVLWFIFDNGRYEAVIAGIVPMGGIIASVFCKKEKNKSDNNIELKHSGNNIIIQDNNGRISINK